MNRVFLFMTLSQVNQKINALNDELDYWNKINLEILIPSALETDADNLNAAALLRDEVMKNIKTDLKLLEDHRKFILGKSFKAS